jgi:hypothetical protein
MDSFEGMGRLIAYGLGGMVVVLMHGRPTQPNTDSTTPFISLSPIQTNMQ